MNIARLKHQLSTIGPGIAIAATGIGAGDMVAAAVSGARYGYSVIWAALIGALLKYVLNEGLARWQLATGTTLLEGWIQRLGRWIQYYFLLYLILWSFIVGGALIAACGLAAHAILPQVKVETWGVIHSLTGLVVVWVGRYEYFERMMKFFISFMFITILGCALWVEPPSLTLWRSLSEAAIPAGSPKFILSVIGGVGGSLTMLAYGYWIREKEWHGGEHRDTVRVDLGVSYFLTGIFGVAIMVLAAAVLHEKGIEVAGSQGVLQMAGILGEVVGRFGHWAFLIGFWGAVSTSLLGVWQGIPYLFCDFVALARNMPAREREVIVDSKSLWYRSYLLWLALPPLTLLLLNRPVWLIVLYSVVGSLFMPFLAGTLLVMNSKRNWVGELRSSAVNNALLILCLMLFAYLFGSEIIGLFV